MTIYNHYLHEIAAWSQVAFLVIKNFHVVISVRLGDFLSLPLFFPDVLFPTIVTFLVVALFPQITLNYPDCYICNLQVLTSLVFVGAILNRSNCVIVRWLILVSICVHILKFMIQAKGGSRILGKGHWQKSSEKSVHHSIFFVARYLVVF